MSKTSAIPKTVVEPSRRALYDKALQVLRQTDPDANISKLVRGAMDKRCASILGVSEREFKTQAAESIAQWE